MSPARRGPAWRTRVGSLAFVAGLLACNGIITGPDAGPSTTPRSMRIAPARLDLVLGQSAQVTAELYNGAGGVTLPEGGVPLAYSSLDPLVATVDAAGTVTATGGGSTTVRAAYGALSLGIPVAVTAVRPRIELVSGGAQTAEQGEALPAPVVLRAIGGAGTPVAGLVVAFSVVTGGGQVGSATATTDGAGLAQSTWTLGATIGAQSVQGVSAGYDAVVVTASATASTRVTRVLVTPRTASLPNAGATVQLTAEAYNAYNGIVPGVPFAWASLDTAIARVDAVGLVTAVAPGAARITVANGSARDTATITVAPPAPLPKLALGADRTHPAGLQAERSVAVSAAVAAPLTVTLRSLDLGTLLVSASATAAGGVEATVQIGAGNSSATYWMQGIEESSGRVVQVVAEAVGYESDTVQVTLTRPAFVLQRAGPGVVPASGGEDPIVLLTIGEDAGDGALLPMAARAGGVAPSFTLASSVPARAQLRFFASTFTVGADQGPATGVTFAIAPGQDRTSDGQLVGQPASVRLVRTGATGVLDVDATGPSEYVGIFASVQYSIIAGPTPIIGAAPTALDFTVVAGAPSPSAQQVAVTNTGTGTLSGLSASVAYGAGASGWLALALDRTDAPATLTATPSTTALAAGTYTATITLASSVSGVAPRDVGVTLTVGASGTQRFSLGVDVQLPAGLQDRRQFDLIDAPTAPVTITFRSLTPGAVLFALEADSVGAAVVTVDASVGLGGFSYWVQGIEGASGSTALVVAEAPGYVSDTMVVTVVRPSFNLYRISPDDPPVTGGEDPSLVLEVGLYVTATSSLQTRAVRAGGAAPSFTLVSDAPARAQLRHLASPATIGADQGPATSVIFSIAPGRWRTSDGEVEGEPISLRLTRAGEPGFVSISATGPAEYDAVAAIVSYTLIPAAIGVSPESLDWEVVAGAPSPAALTFSVNNVGAGELTGLSAQASYDANPGLVSGWLSLAFDSTTAPATVTVTPTTNTIPPGTYTGSILVSSSLSGVDPVGVPFTLVVTAPVLPKLDLGPDITQPAWLQTPRTVQVPANVAAPVMVTVRSLDSTGVLVSASQADLGFARDSVEVEGGTREATYWTHGVENAFGRVVTFIATAPGYAPDTMVVTVVNPAFTLSHVGPDTVPATGGEDPIFRLTVGQETSPGVLVPMAVRTGGQAPNFTVLTYDPDRALVQFFAGSMTVGDDQGPASEVSFSLAPGVNTTSTVDPASLRLARTGVGGSAGIFAVSPSGFIPSDGTLAYTFTGGPTGTLSWINPAGGSWDDGANWSTGIAPTATDTAVIALAGTYTVSTVDQTVRVGRLVIGDDGVSGGTATLQLAAIILDATEGISILPGGVIDFRGGSISGADSGIVNEGTIVLRDFNGGPATVTSALSGGGEILVRGVGAINGTLTTRNSTLIEIAAQYGDSAVLTVANGFEMRGRIVLTNIDPESALLAALVVTDGTLRLEEPGRLVSEQGISGGARVLRAELNNGYRVDVDYPLVIDRPSAAHRNSGYIEITGGDLTILQSGISPSFTNNFVLLLHRGYNTTISGGTFTNNRSILGPGNLDVAATTFVNPGSLFTGSEGVLAISGAVPMTATSEFTIELRGTVPEVDFARLDATGAVTLDGVLNVFVNNGFVPAIGQSFTILTAPSVTGTFTDQYLPALPSGVWQVEYSATSVILRVVTPP